MTLFSTPSTTPSEVATPIAVEPSLMASSEYSTWNRRPSGEKVLIPRSKKIQYPGQFARLKAIQGRGMDVDLPYSERAINILAVFAIAAFDKALK